MGHDATSRAHGTATRVLRAVLGVPVSIKIMGIALGSTLLLGFGMLWQIHETWHRRLLQEIEMRGKLLGTTLAAHGRFLVASGRLADLQQLLEDSQALNPDVEYLMVLDSRGDLVAHTFSGEPPAAILAANAPRPDGLPHGVLIETATGPVHDVAVTVPSDRGGVVRVGMNERFVASEVRFLVRKLATVTAVIGAIGMLAVWILTAALTRPIRELVGLTRAIRDGQYERKAEIRAKDEIGELAGAFDEMTAALREKESARRRLLRQVLGAAEEERKRVARDLHDHTGQSLTSLIAGLGALEAAEPAAQAKERIAGLRELAVQTLGEVHDLSRDLRPSVLDDLGLVAALQRHGAAVGARFGVTVDCQNIGFDQGDRLPSEVEVAVYRMTQEAITNAIRHGGAKSVQVMLQRKGADLLVVIEDDGRGFDTGEWRNEVLRAGHLGLLGIEERVGLFGGTFRIESRPGSGTSLFVEIPIPFEVARVEDPDPDRG